MNGEKKKLLIIAGALVGLIVLVTIILLVVHAVNNKTITYAKIEEKVLTATKKYYEDNKTLLPEDNKQVTISDAALTSAGYLKSMSDLTAKLNVTCTSESVVTNSNGKYRYAVLLDCGEKYSTKTLSNYIKSKGTVASGTGLYQLNGELVYRGEKPNNYVKLSGKMYRIVKITNTDNVVLILNEKIGSAVWDNRFNTERNSSDGKNDYTISRMKDTLGTLDIIKDEYMNLLKPYTLYIGRRDIHDVYNDGSLEKSAILENQIYGLLPLYDYLNASIDENCTSALTNSCVNYNYLSRYNYNWWTITADSNTTYKVYRISSGGSVSLTYASGNAYVRPVIQLVSDAIYLSGDGTFDNPYIVK